MGGFNKYLIWGVFFSFNAVASVDYICLRVGRVRPGGGGGYNLRPDYFFFKQEGQAGRGDDLG